MFDKLTLIGVGLIGGSIARAARLHGLAGRIVGYGRKQDEDNLKAARRLDIIDDYVLDIERAVDGADGVIIATPVGAIHAIVSALKPVWSERTVYSDVGSTKGNVIAAIEQVFGFMPGNFVPAHPIAGAECSGVSAAVDDLFLNKRLIITPLEGTAPEALARMQDFWQRLGAQVFLMAVDQHDSVLAATSHLPHLLAFALVDLLGRKNEQAEIFKYAAGGFKDFTRIASSDPVMWVDICLANRQEILPLIEQFKSELDALAQALASDDDRRLFETFSHARQARQRFLDQYL
ncbi:MAG: prephenate dehydrogenase/arogenate dehydrogenase family protein [Gammaproteobacteria bacterium HGW-Gammaproteobacteria-3]|jgi:prephenate dehydrogenase|nr:MAG: prephenate dehydrogenase/arogenate dehydrogenase family protein [Gammaproteobacteria bacterium HGW-Gammaproteobacteria-3]